MIDIFTGLKYLSLLTREKHSYDKEADSLLITFSGKTIAGARYFYDNDLYISYDKNQMPIVILISHVHDLTHREDVKRDIKEVPDFVVNAILEHFGFTRKELGW